MKTTFYEKMKDGQRFRKIPNKLAIERLRSHYHGIEDICNNEGTFKLETTWAYYKVVAEKE